MQASSGDLAGDILSYSNRPVACYYAQGLASDNLTLYLN